MPNRLPFQKENDGILIGSHRGWIRPAVEKRQFSYRRTCSLDVYDLLASIVRGTVRSHGAGDNDIEAFCCVADHEQNLSACQSALDGPGGKSSQMCLVEFSEQFRLAQRLDRINGHAISVS